MAFRSSHTRRVGFSKSKRAFDYTRKTKTLGNIWGEHNPEIKLNNLPNSVFQKVVSIIIT